MMVVVAASVANCVYHLKRNQNCKRQKYSNESKENPKKCLSIKYIDPGEAKTLKTLFVCLNTPTQRL